ncbi:Nitrogen assimilation regulatory protein [Fundidesulfovibrio magnetotacticus]|uniref:Nitrogen assimilation regulatory protein n=1 Tax=Fundidesulfovibrio magnetotacticus TaxID=2730080 RepID=A0A6V8LT98_9BACT|nr:response regulator [Fundidesulfovibrio magnetotacticus]GFK93801.1 Nitrogen assimilation regulatory protein [Fundidesulfovibrio magnetotacticus]
MATAASNPPTVILADRNRHIRELLAREFAREGYAVKGCGLGREAALLAAAEGDILVVDGELPDMDAGRVVSEVRRVRPGLPVAVYAHEEDEARPCLGQPMVFYVPKRDDPAGLVKAVLEALRARPTGPAG